MAQPDDYDVRTISFGLQGGGPGNDLSSGDRIYSDSAATMQKSSANNTHDHNYANDAGAAEDADERTQDKEKKDTGQENYGDVNEAEDGENLPLEKTLSPHQRLSELAASPPAHYQRDSSTPKGIQYKCVAEEGQQDGGIPLAEMASGTPASLHSTRRRNSQSIDRQSSRRLSKSESPPPRVSHTATQFYIASYLILFSILGTLARVGLQALTFYPGAPVITSVLWANVGGCLLMGFFIEDRNLFQQEWGNGSRQRDEHWVKQHKTVKKTIPLYIGLTTGFCGSFTSFSSFMRDTFLALSNELPNPSGPLTGRRNGGYSLMAMIAVIMVTVSLSLSSLILGAHLALVADPITPTVPFRFCRKVLDRVVVVLAWGCWVGAVIMAIWPPDRSVSPETETWRGRAVFAITFAPLGCLLRFYMSILLNARVPTFPLGTFTVNIFGSIIEAMCYDLQHVHGIGAAASIMSETSLPSSSSSSSPSLSLSILTSCQVLQGIMDGFCGCTTTVSTWVAELYALGSRRRAYLYGSVSIGVALGFMVIIMGSLQWTIGFSNPVCS
jgi:fluoride exporter